MVWSKPQVVMAGIASTLAGWNAAQRYIALRHAGCPNLPKARLKGDEPPRPSFAHPQNDQGCFERFMALAEASARSRGADMRSFPSPRSGGAESWAEKEQRDRDRVIRWIDSMWDELARLVSDVFAGVPGTPPRAGLCGFVRRMTMHDDPTLTFGVRPACLEECDAAQLYRIGEGLKAWGTRECARRGLTPATFTFNRREIARMTA